MDNSLFSPIKKENFTDVWQQADEMYVTARKRSALCGFAGFFAHLSLIPLVLYFVSGVLQQYTCNAYVDFLVSQRWFINSWDWIWSMLNIAGLEWYYQAGVLLLVVLGAALVVFLFFSLLLLAVYHPLQSEMPSEHPEAADTLVEILTEARRYAAKTSCKSSTGCIFLFCCVLALIMVFILQAEDPALALRQFTNIPWLQFLENSELTAAVLGVALLLGYAFIDNLLGSMLRVLYRCQIPYSAVAEAQRYYSSLKLKSDVLSEEEIQARIAAYAIQKRIDALELERTGKQEEAQAYFLDAALAGDAPAMKQHARYCISSAQREQAIYWLERYTDANEDDSSARRALRQLRGGDMPDAGLLK